MRTLPSLGHLTGGIFFEEIADEEILRRPDGTELRFVSLPQLEEPAPKEGRPSVLIVQGWNETYLRYLPLAEMLHSNGYSVFMYDHRGQGLSSRYPCAHRQCSVIDSFSQYVEDLKAVTERLRQLEPKGELLVVAHSMGCLVACTLLLEQPDIFQRIVLSSPMFAIRSTHPTWLVHLIMTCISAFGLGNRFAPDPDHHPIDARGPVKELLTHDKDRLRELEEVWRLVPFARCGGVSPKWIKACIGAQRRFMRSWKRISIPVLLLQADEDVFVYNCTQTSFWRANPNVKRIFFPGAYHELLNEGPIVRGACEKAIRLFLKGEDGKGDERDRFEELPSGLPRYRWGFVLHHVSHTTAAVGMLSFGWLMYEAARRGPQILDDKGAWLASVLTKMIDSLPGSALK
mmetsp:Transcript_4389/g.17253  ORF Transcript_4389/g.17253 Transcript_4389/m.17253 type:complete len:401 (-) Transcript_4389:1408-2610(-)